MHVYKLSSGAELKITIAPFAEAEDLLNALLEEGKDIRIHRNGDAFELCKNIICFALPSKRVKACLQKCLERSTYNGTVIKDVNSLFEDEKAREDYIEVLMKVAEVNVRPFTKSLSALLSAFMEMISSSQA